MIIKREVHKAEVHDEDRDSELPELVAADP